MLKTERGPAAGEEAAGAARSLAEELGLRPGPWEAAAVLTQGEALDRGCGLDARPALILYLRFSWNPARPLLSRRACSSHLPAGPEALPGGACGSWGGGWPSWRVASGKTSRGRSSWELVPHGGPEAPGAGVGGDHELEFIQRDCFSSPITQLQRRPPPQGPARRPLRGWALPGRCAVGSGSGCVLVLVVLSPLCCLTPPPPPIPVDLPDSRSLASSRRYSLTLPSVCTVGGSGEQEAC